jgi:murein DD-endopeptidase MepM/ murein hydrolase activator NlpD
MRRTKRNTHRRPAGLVLKRTDRPSRFAFHFLAVLGILVLAGAVFSNFLMPGDTQSSIDFSAAGVDIRHGSDLSEMNATGPDAELPVAEAPREPEITRMTEVIKSGDTPSSLLEGCMALPDIYNLCNQSKDVFPLNNIRAGRSWTMIYSDEALVGLEYEISSDERLVVSMTDSGYEFRRETIPFEMETKTVSGVIESSLLGAIAKIGENDELGVRLANVFAYDVDFTRDLREGDSFKAIVEKKTRNGKFIGYGEILAASFSNREQTYYAYSYTGANGDTAYYDENGHPLRKAFLKSPLAFSRISSGYSMNRLHPVLKYRCTHGHAHLHRRGRVHRPGRLQQVPGKIHPHQASQRLRDHLQPHEQIRRRIQAGRQGEAGPDHRLRRKHRLGHRLAPGLPHAAQRQSHQSPQDQERAGQAHSQAGTARLHGRHRVSEAPARGTRPLRRPGAARAVSAIARRRAAWLTVEKSKFSGRSKTVRCKDAKKARTTSVLRG